MGAEQAPVLKVTEVVDGFKRIVEISGAWDRRHDDPAKNYGIGGMGLRFVLVGPLGAVQFAALTTIYPQHVQYEHKGEPQDARKLIGADIGYHSPKPRYEGQAAFECTHIEGGTCYYDGSSLQAYEYAAKFIEDPNGVWELLRERYRGLFEEAA